ncbi:MAG: hypothetical protein COA73_05650 [Candidatus Hydrogenedentota bacterium]|nr:MAG: hypothetical protein COA73_05650 [Candidatus Hydrogenedentota bacterium]
MPREGIAYVNQDILDATFQYPTGSAEAIGVALKILNNEAFEKCITLPSRIFTKANVADGGESLE